MAEIKVYLTLIGDDFDPNYVTKEIGIRPVYVREKNEILGNGRLFGHFEWGIETELMQTDDLSNIPDQLISTIPCGLDVLLHIAQKCKAQWNVLILVNVYDSFPALYFSKDFIQVAGYIGATVGFDVYLHLNQDEDD